MNAVLLSGFASGLAGAALFASSYGVHLMTRRARQLSEDLTANAASRTTRLDELETRVRELSERFSEVEHRKVSLWDCGPEQRAINLNRRGQVLRLFRRGDTAAQIASTLGLSKGEVMLIVKVHELGRAKADVEDFPDSL